MTALEAGADAAVRAPAVAGTFYPADPARLDKMIAALLAGAPASPGPATGAPLGILVPHAGLAYSGLVAAAGWRLVPDGTTVVILGTNHTAAWLDDVGAWETGGWRTPLGEVAIDTALAAEICALGPPFGTDRGAHRGEHSIEVQLPLVQTIAPHARIVPLSVATGIGENAIDAGVRLGEVLAERRRAGQRVVIAISSDMAHYPRRQTCDLVTEALLPAILALDPVALAADEQALVAGVAPGLVCGMCGIEPAVLGLAALRALGAKRGIRLAAATSADAGGPPDRTVGYLSVAFTT